jgi:hypothetical protein
MATSIKTYQGMPVVRAEPFTMPNGLKAEICVYYGKRFGAVLRLSNGNTLPLSAGGSSAAETLQQARSFLTSHIRWSQKSN